MGRTMTVMRNGKVSHLVFQEVIEDVLKVLGVSATEKQAVEIDDLLAKFSENEIEAFKEDALGMRWA